MSPPGKNIWYNSVMKSVSNCIVCARPLSGKQRSFCSISCKNEYYLNYDALKARATKRKSELIQERGGSCNCCGYGSSLDALSFYDVEGETLGVDTNILANSSATTLKKKLVGAKVLCRNCYEEIQNPSHVSSRPSKTSGEIPQGMLRDSSAAVGMTVTKFTDNLADSGLKAGQTIVLGVSGGIDSVVMLDLFAKNRSDLSVIVAHMNHGLRKESDADEKFVSTLAKKHNYKYKHSQILKNLRISGNQEEYFRDERRKFLLDTANGNGAKFVALAHNADDQAETFIMNAVRGSGPAGLGAMSMNEGQLLRPLLNISRAEIIEYARENGLYWHEDETNKDLSYKRNYIRHRLLPMLEQMNPEFLSAIHRTTYLQRKIDEHLKEEAHYVIQYATVIPAKAGIQRGEGLDSSSRAGMTIEKGVSAEHLRRLDKPLLYEVLGLLYEEAKGDRQDLSLAHLAAVEELIQSNDGTKTLDLPGNVEVGRHYDRLDFHLKLAHNIPSTPSTKKLKIGEQRFGTWNIQVETLPKCHPEQGEGSRAILRSTQNDRNTLVIDAEILTSFSIRTRKPGDRIVSLGMAGRKKLQDLFVDAKIDRDKRDGWPIFFDHDTDEVIWVPYLAKTVLIPKTKKLLKIKITEVPHETT